MKPKKLVLSFEFLVWSFVLCNKHLLPLVLLRDGLSKKGKNGHEEVLKVKVGENNAHCQINVGKNF